MWRKYGVGLGLAAFVAVLGAREWLVRSEISTLQTEIQTNIKDQFSAATDGERLDRLTSAPIVYERFLEPVLIKTNKLLSPFTRSDLLNSWRRDVHQLIDDQTYTAEARLKTTVNKQVETIQQSEEPSIARLLKVVDEKSKLGARANLQDVIKFEIQKISNFAQEKDKETLALIRIQGIESLKLVKNKVHKLDLRELAKIVEPVTTLIFKLRREETRRQTWAEFNRSLEDLLSKRRERLAQNSKKATDEENIQMDAKKFQKLFNQVAEAVTREDAKNQKPAEEKLDEKSADNPASLDYDDSSTMTQ